MTRLSGTQLDHVFVALADETRRAILERLSAGEARVTEVAAPFPISLNSVSKHIQILERAGFVTRRVAGRDHYLRLQPQTVAVASKWLLSRQQFWTQRLQRLAAVLDEEDAMRKPTKRSRR